MKIRESKAFKIISTIIRVIFILFIITFICVVYLQRFSDNKVSFFKFRMFTVISESMLPKYEIGDVLFAKEVDPSTIKVGDDISYLGTSGDVKDKIVTHQVTNVEQDDDGKYLFRAKGLSNIIEDPIISEDQLYGVVVYKSVIISLVYKIVATNIGFYLCIIVPIIYIITHEIISTLLEKEEKRRAQ